MDALSIALANLWASEQQCFSQPLGEREQKN